MFKHFLGCLSLKSGALVTAFLNLVIGLSEIIAGAVVLHENRKNEFEILFICSIVIGLLAVFSGLILTFAIIQNKDKFTFLYLLTGIINIMTMVLYCGMNMFQYRWLFFLFLLYVFLCYCHFCIYAFYLEMVEYNSNVKSGVIEIAYDEGGYKNSIPIDDALESTAV